MPAASPTRFCSLTPSMKKRDGISFLKSLSTPTPRSEPIKTTRSSCRASSNTDFRQLSRMNTPSQNRKRLLRRVYCRQECSHHIVGDFVLVVPLHVVFGEAD